jgi:hypothetical protein
MGFEKNYLEIDLSTGSTFNVVLEAENNIVYAFGTATGNVAIGVNGSSTPRKGMKVEFIYDGVMGANTLTVFGTNIPVASDNVKGLFNFYYNGTAWLPLFNPSTDTAYLNNGQVRSDAAIALDKLATLTASRIPQINASGVIEPSATNISFLALLGALTQSAANYNKVGAFSGTTADLDLLAGADLAGLTQAELFYLIGVTSNIQTQLNTKANASDISGLVQLRTFDVTIPSADVLTLNSDPIALVPAQGANTIIVPFNIQGQLIFNSAAYTTNLTLQIFNGGTTTAATFSTGFLGSSVTKQAVNANITTALLATDTQYVPNSNLIATVGTADPLAGDSDIRLFGTYLVLTL